MLVTRAFLDLVTEGLNTTTVQRVCHPGSGALLDHTATALLPPPAALAALVRHRDGRCRFPGCHVNARFCDLDHVRPWPSGPTTAANLICLCRRHHRIKQRLGWRVRLHPDATATFTDPTGRARTTHPVDALHTLVLHAPVYPANAADANAPTDAVGPMTATDPAAGHRRCSARPGHHRCSQQERLARH